MTKQDDLYKAVGELNRVADKAMSEFFFNHQYDPEFQTGPGLMLKDSLAMVVKYSALSRSHLWTMIEKAESNEP